MELCKLYAMSVTETFLILIRYNETIGSNLVAFYYS